MPLEKEPVTLGSNSTFSWGRVSLHNVEVKAWQPTAVNQPVVPFSAEEIQSTLQSGAKSGAPPRHIRLSFKMQLSMEGAFLVCAPKGSLQSLNVPGAPDHIPRLAEAPPALDSLVTRHQRMAGARALLPASSVKGALRAHLERIIRTDWPTMMVSPWDSAEEKIEATPKFLRVLFGSTDSQSLLTATDFQSVGEDRLRVRELVSIDRWTGSVAGSAKFNVLAFEQPTLVGNLILSLPTKSFSDCERLAAIGLLALLLRDVIEGQVQFGFGDTKGFGHGTCEILEMNYGGQRSECEKLLGLMRLPTQLVAVQGRFFQSCCALSPEQKDQAINVALQNLDEVQSRLL